MRPLVIGNWKMHGSLSFARELATTMLRSRAQVPDIDMGLCPSFVFLPAVAEALSGTSVLLGAQTCSEFDTGAYTGEVSPVMLRELGCELVLVGHSERRQLFGEGAATIAAKAACAQAQGLTPVICVGETLAERRTGSTEQVIADQLAPLFALDNVATLLSASVIAYEPVWAIGTGETASPEQAQTVHGYIRSLLSECSASRIGVTRILYGGSVKPSNAAELFAMPDIDGGLIGGASLKADDFFTICAAAQRRAVGQ